MSTLEIYPGQASAAILQMIDVNGRLYFVDEEPGPMGQPIGFDLWKSDGTAGSTTLVQDFAPRTDLGKERSLANINGTLYFSADDGVKGVELWTSDGTSAGTDLVSDIRPGATGSYPDNLTFANGALFFSAEDGTTGTEVWRILFDDDPQPELVRDIVVGGNANPQNFVAYNGLLYFTARGGGLGTELWVTDGWAATTEQVKDIFPGAGSSAPLELTVSGGRLFFSAEGNAGNLELWVSDGTSDGTVLVKDIRDGALGSDPTGLVDWNGTLFFSADDGLAGRQLWKSNGTAAGTVPVYYPTYPSLPYGFVDVNGTAFFGAADGKTGIELWKSNGTETGTVLVKNIYPEPPGGPILSSAPSYLTNVNGTLYFAADFENQGRELGKSDGTAAGTVLVTDNLVSGPGSSNPDNLTNFNGVLFFSALDSVTGQRVLWRSLGEISSTIKVTTAGGAPIYNPAYLTVWNGRLYFAATVAGDRELWVTDPQGFTASQVANINLAGSSSPRHLTVAGSKLFFTADTGNTDPENPVVITGLWATQGPTGPTGLVYNVPAINLASYGGQIFFSGFGELWKSDGTGNGTIPLKDAGGNAVFNPALFTSTGGQLFFISEQGFGGNTELWKTTAQVGGTSMVKEINPTGGSFPHSLVNGFGTLYFAANDGIHGFELWKSDGTAAGTVLVKDVWEGSSSGVTFGYLTVVGGHLYFAGDDGMRGVELWDPILNAAPVYSDGVLVTQVPDGDMSLASPSTAAEVPSATLKRSISNAPTARRKPQTGSGVTTLVLLNGLPAVLSGTGQPLLRGTGPSFGTSPPQTVRSKGLSTLSPGVGERPGLLLDGGWATADWAQGNDQPHHPSLAATEVAVDPPPFSGETGPEASQSALPLDSSPQGWSVPTGDRLLEPVQQDRELLPDLDKLLEGENRPKSYARDAFWILAGAASWTAVSHGQGSRPSSRSLRNSPGRR